MLQSLISTPLVIIMAIIIGFFMGALAARCILQSKSIPDAGQLMLYVIVFASFITIFTMVSYDAIMAGLAGLYAGLACTLMKQMHDDYVESVSDVKDLEDPLADSIDLAEQRSKNETLRDAERLAMDAYSTDDDSQESII